MVHPEREDGGTVAVKEIGDLTGRKSGRAREGKCARVGRDGAEVGGSEREEKTAECPRCTERAREKEGRSRDGS